MEKKQICFRRFLSHRHFIVYDRATSCAACASVGPLTIDVMSQQRQQEADLWPWRKSAVTICLITWAASAAEKHLSKTVSKQHAAPASHHGRRSSWTLIHCWIISGWTFTDETRKHWRLVLHYMRSFGGKWRNLRWKRRTSPSSLFYLQTQPSCYDNPAQCSLIPDTAKSSNPPAAAIRLPLLYWARWLLSSGSPFK